MLHVEACTPRVSESLASTQLGHDAPSVAQHRKRQRSKGPGAGAEPQGFRNAAEPPELQDLSKSWQALADVICEAGLRAVEAQPSGDLHDKDCHTDDALAEIGDISGAVQEWGALRAALESRAWWWGKAVLDARLQACFLETGKLNAAYAMAIVSDFVLGQHRDLEIGAAVLKKRLADSDAGSWARNRVELANEIFGILQY